MNRWLLIFLSFWTALFSVQAHAKSPEQKLKDIAWVVYCEDHTDEKASMLVMSTIYNRAESHNVHKLHTEIVKKRQYYCHRIKPTAKKLNSEKYKAVNIMVRDFIEEQQPPTTKARFFYNHKLVSRSRLGNMRLRVAEVHGSHTYLY